MVILFANSAIEPEIYSAKPFPISFADLSIRPYKASFTRNLSPAFAPRVTAPASKFVTAFSEKVKVSSKFPFSITSKAVIILVIDAGLYLLSLFFSNKISFVFASIKIAASEDILGFSIAAKLSIYILVINPDSIIITAKIADINFFIIFFTLLTSTNYLFL